MKAKPILILILVFSALFFLPGIRLPSPALADSSVFPTPAAPKEAQGSGYDALHQPVHVEGVSPSQVLASDGFGYSYDDSPAINWVDASNGEDTGIV